MATSLSHTLHASRVKYLRVVHACGHPVDVKISPTTSSANVRAITREAKRSLCPACRRHAGAPRSAKP
jgi:hypothetical protein